MHISVLWLIVNRLSFWVTTNYNRVPKGSCDQSHLHHRCYEEFKITEETLIDKKGHIMCQYERKINSCNKVQI